MRRALEMAVVGGVWTVVAVVLVMAWPTSILFVLLMVLVHAAWQS